MIASAASFEQPRSAAARVVDDAAEAMRGNAALLLVALAGLALVALAAWRLAGRADAASIAVLLGAGLLAVAVSRPRMALLGMLGVLVVLGELRRWVDFASRPSANDPLLLLVPAAAMALLAGLFLRGRLTPSTPAAKTAGLLMGLMVLQAFNPLQGGLVVGFAGLLFYLVPLLWFFLGRAYGGEMLTPTLVAWLVVLAVIAGFAGLAQTLDGFSAHQQAWLDRAGYSALDVDGSTRPFSILTSSSEYAHLLGLTAAASVALVSARRGRAVILAVPFLLVAMFLQGSRGPVVLFTLAVCAVYAVGSGGPRQWIPRAVLAGGVVVGVATFGLQRLDGAAAPAEVSSLVQHQADGLLNPLDREHSTLGIHAGMAAYGLAAVVENPLGRGVGSTTLAARKFGGEKVNMEFDFANVGLGLGLAGLVLYVVLVLQCGRNLMTLWMRERSATALVTTAVLVATLSQWLNGGMYAVAAVVWFLLGSCDGIAERHAEDRGGSDTSDPRTVASDRPFALRSADPAGASTAPAGGMG